MVLVSDDTNWIYGINRGSNDITVTREWAKTNAKDS